MSGANQPNQRAFSTRIIRESAGNVRRHAASTVGSGGPGHRTGTGHGTPDISAISSSTLMAGIARTSVATNRNRPMSTTSSSHTIVSDTTEAIDYEEYVSQSMSERDPLAQVMDFPEDDIEVNLVPRKIRTMQHVLPEEPYEELDPIVQNCVDCYTSDWVVVTRKYQQYSSSVTIRDRHEEKVQIVNTTPRQEFELDASPDNSPQSEEVGSLRKLIKLRKFRLGQIANYNTDNNRRSSFLISTLNRTTSVSSSLTSSQQSLSSMIDHEATLSSLTSSTSSLDHQATVEAVERSIAAVSRSMSQRRESLRSNRSSNRGSWLEDSTSETDIGQPQSARYHRRSVKKMFASQKDVGNLNRTQPGGGILKKTASAGGAVGGANSGGRHHFLSSLSSQSHRKKRLTFSGIVRRNSEEIVESGGSGGAKFDSFLQSLTSHKIGSNSGRWELGRNNYDVTHPASNDASRAASDKARANDILLTGYSRLSGEHDDLRTGKMEYVSSGLSSEQSSAGSTLRHSVSSTVDEDGEKTPTNQDNSTMEEEVQMRSGGGVGVNSREVVKVLEAMTRAGGSQAVARADGPASRRFSLASTMAASSTSLSHEVGSRDEGGTEGTPRGSWASFDLRSSRPDQLVPGLLDKVDPDLMDQMNDKRRQTERPEALFSLYPEQDEFDMVERRTVAEIPTEQQGHRILVNCLELTLSLQEVEPMFASMALYDARERRKVSENFYFDRNTEAVKKMLTGHIEYADISTHARACVFDIASQPGDLFLVVKLEKVLQGDMNEAIEPYIKDERNLEKVRSAALDACKRLGRYRMPFAWTAIELAKIFRGIPLTEPGGGGSDGDSTGSNSLDRKSSASVQEAFRRQSEKAGVGGAPAGGTGGSGSLTRRGSLDRKDKRSSWAASETDLTASLDNFPPVTLTVSSFFKQEGDKLKDDDLYKHLQDLKRPSPKLKQLKSIKGCLKLDISVAGESVNHCLTPELAKLRPYPNPMARPCKEILNFPPKNQDSSVESPHYQFRNILYVSPKELNFSNRSGERARNIAVKVQLMSGEGEEFALPVIFGKSNCPEMTREAYTAVTYHNKTPDFYEEVKIRLPSNLRDNHHLLFTFYHVTCKGQVKEGERLVTPVGYTWIPLLEKGSLATGEHNLPVTSDPPPSRFSFIPTDRAPPGSTFKWIDNKKCIFTVEIEAVSSLHTESEQLDSFLAKTSGLQLGQKPARIADKDMEQDMVKCLREVRDARPEALVAFMPLILDKLLLLMVKPPTVAGLTLNVGQAAFSAMADVVKAVSRHLSHRNDPHGRNSLLSTYIQYQAHLPHLDPALSALSHTGGNRRNIIHGDGETDPVSALRNLNQAALDRGDLSGNTLGMVPPMGKLVHEQLALQLTLSKESARELALDCSWFFFELMIKAMIEHLATAGTLNAPRKHRFSEQFNDDILNMVASLTNDIIRKYKKQEKRIEQLNACLAFFLHDLLSVMDRGFVFSLIRTYMKDVTGKISDNPEGTTSLWELQIDFLRIICSHEHFVPLNLPQYGPNGLTSGTSSPTPSMRSIDSAASFISTMMGDRSSWAELSSEFRRQHFLAGLCLTNLHNALEQENGDVHSKSVALVRNLLTCHDIDPRYGEPDCRARVGNLYLPLVGIIVDAVGCLYGASDLSFSREEVTTPVIDQITAQQIAGSAMFGTVENGKEPQHHQRPAKCSLSQDSTRHLLACFLWVVKNTDRSVLTQWWMDLSAERLNSLCEVLRLTITAFQYKGKKAYRRLAPQQSFRKTSSDVKSHLEDMILGRNHAKEMISRSSSRKGAPPSPNPETRRWASSSGSTRSHMPRLPPDSLDPRTGTQGWSSDLEAHVEGNLATEVSLIVLDTLSVVEQVVSQTDQSQSLLASVLRVILHCLNSHQSTHLLQHLFAIQRSLVSKYPNLLFDEATEHCAALCKNLLRHCSSAVSSIRSQASASLYLLMRQNFEIGNNFARVKMQVTMSLSSLVAEISSSFKFNEEHLRKSLKTILTYAEEDKELSDSFNSFPEQVQDLVFNLHMILSDTVKMKEYLDDPEMHMDLMYRIAKGYQTSPDLRLTWLENMANKHLEHNNHAEAAMCKIHSAALVSEYLHMLEDRKYMPAGAVTYSRLTPNALDESAVSDDVVSPDEEGICTGKNFTENGLIEFLELAADNFTTAGMYEAVNEVYKSVILIHEANRDFKRLAEIHRKLHKAFEKIEAMTGRRVFSTYFRVGFYGSRFGDLDGEEFIYKEPMLTKLPEIANRLESFYGNKYGTDNLMIIKDSKQVELSKLNAEKAYIQITYVEPYFDNYELRDRVTDYERNNNINRFIFATPFTTEGGAHGELSVQYKRKTILTTDNHFPYIKTRIQVSDRKQIVLTPIEVAIEDIQLKVAKLDAAIKANDPKILQMELQGCIGTTVNQGPIEVARVFLRHLFEGKVPTKHENKLRLCFKDLMKKSGDALKRNRQFIKKDQEAYQTELENSYHKCMEYLKPILHPPPGPANHLVHNRSSVSDGPVTSPMV